MLRFLLEKNGQRPTASAPLGQYISIFLKQEVETIKNEMSLPGQNGMTRDVSMIFDGDTRQGEAIAVIVRFLDDDLSIIQCLVRIDTYSKSVKADDIAQVLNQCLSVDYGVKANSLLAAVRDGASVNQAALERIPFIFPKCSTLCVSHIRLTMLGIILSFHLFKVR